MDELRNEDVENLLKVLASFNSEDEIYALFVDLFTIREIKEMSKRLLVARMLDEGKSYAAIEKVAGPSATTIARVSKCLSYGSGGYRAALDVLKEGESE